jgi:hypothetical protein
MSQVAGSHVHSLYEGPLTIVTGQGGEGNPAHKNPGHVAH